MFPRVYDGCLQKPVQEARFAFGASTGRTATMFIAATLNSLPGIVALHEGQTPDDRRTVELPLINVHNRRAWHEPAFRESVVSERRGRRALLRAAGDADLLVDIAFNNSPILVPLAKSYPDSVRFVIFRRCESFVRSATIVEGEDRQPAGWPDRSKPLSDREKFISLGRLKPKAGTEAADYWEDWTAIQRNIWLWTHVNTHLVGVAEADRNCRTLTIEDLAEKPRKFWTDILDAMGHGSGANIDLCVERSATKLNQRRAQVGPVDSWSEAERALFDRLVPPLESKIYG